MTDSAPAVYKVVIDRENQYSLWPINQDLPTGWLETGKTGDEKECLVFINENAPNIKHAKTKQTGK